MVFHKRSFSLVALLASVSVFAVGCGKDQTVEEYNRGKLQKSISVYQEISGTYTGTVVSPVDGKVLGALQLDLSVDTRTSTGSGSDTAGGVPLLVTNIRYLDKTQIGVTVDSSYYDQDTGVFNAQYKAVATIGGQSEDITLALQGQISGNQISGQISTLNSPESYGRFSVQKNGRSINDIASDGTSGTLATSGTTKTYKGKGTRPNGKVETMYLRVTRPARTPRLDFLEVFYPDADKALNVSIQIHEAVTVTVSSVRWDSKNGELHGSQENVGGGIGYTSFVDCTGFYFLRQKEKFSCTYSSSRSPVIPLTFEP